MNMLFVVMYCDAMEEMYKYFEFILKILSAIAVIQYNCVLGSSESTESGTVCGSNISGLCQRCEHYTLYPLVSKGKNKILKLHNEFRDNVASGQEIRGIPGPQPMAANMRFLTWNKNLAERAQNIIKDCKYDNQGDEDINGNNEGDSDINIGVCPKTYDSKSDVEQIIEEWFKEVEYFNKDTIKFFNSASETDRFAKIIWANTNQIGCARGNSSHNIKLVCVYSPKGNVPGKPVYEIGKPCSNCPMGNKCSEMYSSLCTGKHVNGSQYGANGPLVIPPGHRFYRQVSEVGADDDSVIINDKKYRKGVWLSGACSCPTNFRSVAFPIYNVGNLIYIIIFAMYAVYKNI